MDPRRRSGVIQLEWLSLDELDARLKAYPPIGMFLCANLQAQCEDDPASLIDRPSEDDLEEGIGTYQSWGGFADDIPFSIRTGSMESFGSDRTGYGIEVWFPACDGEEASMFEMIAKLPLPVPRVDSIWIETLRPGVFGVARAGEAPRYTSASRRDAIAAMTLLNRWHPSAFAVVDAEAPTDWIVAGPSTGRFISQAWRRPEAIAHRLAASYSTKRGAVFTARPCTDQ